MSCSDIFLGLIAIIFPPIAVCIKTGCCSADVCINVLLCVLGYIPGLLHAWYIIAKFPEHDYDRLDDVERQGRVTYYYVSQQQGQNQRAAGQRTYGTQGTQGGSRAPAVPANKPQSQQQSGTARIADVPDATGPSSSSVGAGSSEQGAPPSYSEVVRGDNKIQSQD